MINIQNIEKKGFTLAEVLITLSIVGIVATLTIPTLINYAFEQQAISRLKKTYAVLADAVLQWQNANGCVGDSSQCPEYAPQYDNNAVGVAEGIAPYLKYSKVYHGPSDAVGKTISWLPDTAYLINGTTISYANWLTLLPDRNQIEYGFGSYFLLPDGTTLIITGAHHYYYAIIDINGPQKPNRIGKDIFLASFWTANHKTFNPFPTNGYRSPSSYGVCGDTSTNVCSADDGHSLTAYVLAHNKLPDLKAMGYPTSP